jgi:hypothetical protein
VVALLLPALFASASAQTARSVAARQVPGALVKDEPRVSGSTAMVASAAYPGLGQLLNGAEHKAAIVSAAEAVLVAALVVEDRRTRNAERMYEQTKDDFWYDEYSEHYDKRQTLVWWVAVAALYGLADAYVDANLTGFDDMSVPALESSFNAGEDGGEFRVGVAMRF